MALLLVLCAEGDQLAADEVHVLGLEVAGELVVDAVDVDAGAASEAAVGGVVGEQHGAKLARNMPLQPDSACQRIPPVYAADAQ
ncbi:hypothetical protein ACIHDR_48240 [Nocardia sp. NPDC052278]|uniref:hypothetical protein n=1 Tax=unclassified Nocardia TaxID=2637762 RepID=UPI00369AD6CA